MRLEAIDIPIIEEAICSFLEEAWGDLAKAHWPKKIDFSSGDRSRVLEGFVDERKNGCMRKYSLRLGNRRYPFMKMIFQELLFRDSFFFCVDTHDELDIKETTPDYAEWEAIREYNSAVKKAVEQHWRRSRIPTLRDVLDEVEDQKVPESELCTLERQPLIYVVDDEDAISEGVRLLLTRRGYEVGVAPCAEDAMKLIAEKIPDLIISDLEMGAGDTGLQFCERLRRNPDTAGVPFILATAAGIDLTRFNLIDGFLVKPYDIEALITFVSKHLQLTKS